VVRYTGSYFVCLFVTRAVCVEVLGESLKETDKLGIWPIWEDNIKRS